MRDVSDGGLLWRKFNGFCEFVARANLGTSRTWELSRWVGRTVKIRVWANERGEFFEAEVGHVKSTIFQDRQAVFNWVSVEIEYQRATERAWLGEEE
jgi:hypothetical protein